MRRISLLLYIVFCAVQAPAQSLTDAWPLHRLQRALLTVTINDNISPVVASRIYVYPHLAFQKAISAELKPLLDKQLPVKYQLVSAKKYRSLTATYAFAKVAQALVYSQSIFEDSLQQVLHWYDQFDIPVVEKAACKKDGEALGLAIIAYLNQDGFKETRHMPKYEDIYTDTKWHPTAPGYFQAIEPNWGYVKPLLLKDLSLDSFPALRFDTAVHSQLYQEAKEVYTISKMATEEQKAIANFWDCNPFALHPYGHYMQAIKKMSPVGHWLCIAQKAAEEKQLDVSSTSRLYTQLAVGLFDALIYCWKLKYQYQFIRPEHFITKTIDPHWEPLLQSPPFPEFPSGHSVISATAAVILTRELGPMVFVDDAELAWNIPPRRFASFWAAADEAAMSRVYGGIHFPYAAQEGKRLGQMIGTTLLKHLNQTSKPSY